MQPAARGNAFFSGFLTMSRPGYGLVERFMSYQGGGVNWGSMTDFDALQRTTSRMR
jgi:hypothetical protein